MKTGSQLYARLDAWAVNKGITKVLEIESARQGAAKFYEFSDELCELSCMAADMLSELSGILMHLEQCFPHRKPRFFYEDNDSLSGVYWFNTASALVPDSDFVSLLIGEGTIMYEFDLMDMGRSPEYYREKRMGALKALNREQTEYVTVIVLGFLTRYRKLLRTAEMIVGVMDGLEIFFTPAVDKKSGGVKHHPSAWV